MMMAAGYAAVEGGKVIKQKVERRKKSTLEGDFIVRSSDPAKNQRRSFKSHVTEARQSLASHTNLMKRSLSKLKSSVSTSRHSSLDESHTTNEVAIFTMGQEVTLQTMEDAFLNGTKALVLQDYFGGRSEGVLVQFLEKKEGHDNYHETGIRIPPENIMVNDENITTFRVDTMVELHGLNAIHMNGLRGMVVEPIEKNINEGRVAVQLLEGSAALISVKPEHLIAV